MNEHLYEITNDLAVLIDKYNDYDTTDEERQALEIKLNEISIKFDEKILSCSHVIEQQESEAEIIQNEIDRLQSRLTAKRNAIKAFKEYVKNCMINAGQDTIKTPIRTVYIKKTKAVRIVDSKKIPSKYCEKRTETVINKTKIKQDIESGVGVSGAELVKNNSLVIL